MRNWFGSVKHALARLVFPFIGQKVVRQQFAHIHVGCIGNKAEAQLHRRAVAAIRGASAGSVRILLGECLIKAFHRSSQAENLGSGVTRNVRSEEHTSELQSLMRISYAVFCLKKKKT